MSIVGIKELLIRVKEDKLFEDLSERELTNPEGTGFDLRVGEIYKLTSGGFLGVENRETSNTELVVKYENNKNNSIIIKPNEYYLIKTIEKINNPKDLAPHFKHRSNLFRSGVVVHTAHCGQGYQGNLLFGIENRGKYDFKLEMGARVIHVVFHKIEGEGTEYRGQWQGGRISTHGMERQV